MHDRARDDAAPLSDQTADFESLVPHAPVDRRGFVLGSLTVGFAAAVAPTGDLLAQTITTPTDGLSAGEVRIPVADGTMPAYRAMPAGKSGLPTVLVVQEIFGVHEHIKDVCRRFARAGYLAIAPELFARQGDPTQYTSVPELFKNIVSKVPDEQVMSDLDATARWASANGGDPARLGITGFCWGGRHVWLYSAHNPALKAGVAWYGRLTGESSPMTPRHPYDVAARLNGPVLGLYGGEDTGIPLTTVNEMKTRLAAGNAGARASEFIVYRDAPHAFHADYRPSYRKDAAEDGWRNALAWFRKHGVA
jgi:carboxymethylenebutenolidase